MTLADVAGWVARNFYPRSSFIESSLGSQQGRMPVRTNSDGKLDISLASSTGTWQPTLTGSSGNPTLTYGIRIGRYWRFGDFVYVNARVHIATLAATGSGSIRISLPFTAANNSDEQWLMVLRPHYNGSNLNGIAFIDPGTDYASMLNASSAVITWASAAALDNFKFTGFYLKEDT